MNSADTNGYMNSYHGRDVRSVIDDEYTISTNCLIKNGKDVIVETDTTGEKLIQRYHTGKYRQARGQGLNGIYNLFVGHRELEIIDHLRLGMRGWRKGNQTYHMDLRKRG
ncbi:MAG: hypothetical protein GY756_14830 [bacterium]|nr:hypothetical protein [bacterium]